MLVVYRVSLQIILTLEFSFSVFLDVSLYIIISSAVRDNFNSFLPTYLSFNYFYCLTALARTFHSILMRTIKVNIFTLVLILRREIIQYVNYEIFLFGFLVIYLFIFFWLMLLMKWEKLLSIPVSLKVFCLFDFIIWTVVKFVKVFRTEL